VVARKKPWNRALGPGTVPRVVFEGRDNHRGTTYVRKYPWSTGPGNTCDRCGRKARRDGRVDVVLVDGYERYRHVACRRGDEVVSTRDQAPSKAVPATADRQPNGASRQADRRCPDCGEPLGTERVVFAGRDVAGVRWWRHARCA
jgi:hypothetical protein